MSRPKSSKELFNSKNFKTEKYVEKGIKILELVRKKAQKLVPDSDINEYQPQTARLDYLKFDSFKAPDTSKK